MSYFFRSLSTRSFWKYALLTPAGASRVFAAVGVIWTFIELLDFFGIYQQAQYSKFAIFLVLGAGILFAVARVRPVARIVYKIYGRDLAIEVKIGDLLEATGGVVISSNTTFDTDIASGLISLNSLQGQFATRFFEGNTNDIDAQILDSLAQKPSAEINRPFGKQQEYELGTVAQVNSHGNAYYFLAMSRLNEQRNAYSSVEMIDTALRKLWPFVRNQGEMQDLSIPLLGTGRGRVGLLRKKMIEKIAQSFVDASRDAPFAKRIIIYIHPSDADNFEINLFEVRDYLSQSIHS